MTESGAEPAAAVAALVTKTEVPSTVSPFAFVTLVLAAPKLRICPPMRTAHSVTAPVAHASRTWPCTSVAR